jgi:hypothetical protein
VCSWGWAGASIIKALLRIKALSSIQTL